MNNPIGDRLRQERQRANLSARELDGLAGLGAGHVSMIEGGRRTNITADTAFALSRVLGCSVGFLLAGEGDAPDAESVRAAVDRARGVDSRPVGADHTASDFTVDSDPTGPVVVREGFDQTGTG